MYTPEELNEMGLDELQDALTDVINARESYPENCTKPEALALDDLYLEIDSRINRKKNAKFGINITNTCDNKENETEEYDSKAEAFKAACRLIIPSLFDKV